MNIVYASDDAFVEPLTVSLTSLLENNRTLGVTIHVISQKITSDNQQRLREVVAKYGHEILFIEMPDIHELVGERVDVKRFSESMFARILTGSLLPDSVKRIIYIDCDTLVVDDLSSLWTYDLGGKAIGAVRDSRNYRYSRNLGMPKGRYYVYSGMLVMDLERYRLKGHENRLVQGIKKFNGLFSFPDNDLICKYLQDDVCYLPLRYNVTTLFCACDFDEITTLRRPEYTYPRAEVDSALQHPAIIHFDTSFLVSNRPWFAKCNHPKTDLWLSYRALTRYATQPLWTTKPTTWRRKVISCIRAMTPRFILIPAVALVHSVVRPTLQAKKLKQYAAYSAKGGDIAD